MTFICRFTIYEMALFLSTLAVIVAWQILTGRINLKGMLDVPYPTSKTSLFRTQLLVVFVWINQCSLIRSERRKLDADQ